MRKYVFKKKRNILLIGTIDFLGNLLFRSPGKRVDNLRKILIVRLDHLGDIVNSTPVYKHLKENLSGCSVSVLTTFQGEEILRGNPFVDQVITFSCPWFKKEKWNPKTLFSLRRKIIKEEFDCALELRGDMRNILLLKFCGVKNIVGYGTGGGGFLLSREMPWEDSLPAVEKNLSLLKGLGVNYSSTSPQIYWDENEEESRWARQFFRDGEFYVAYHSDAGTISKKWPEERFAELMRKVEKAFRVRAVLVGEKKTQGLADNNRLSLQGKTNVRQLIHVLRLSNLLVTNDSGPAHIATALGTPVVVIWSGTSDPKIWAPRGEKVEVVRKDIDCQFCERKSCSSLLCLKRVEVDDVFAAVERVVDENRN